MTGRKSQGQGYDDIVRAGSQMGRQRERAAATDKLQLLEDGLILEIGET